MFAKLMKYNLKKTVKFFVIVYVVMFCAGAVARLFVEFGDTNFTYVMGLICQGICWAGVANLFINNLMRLWADFRHGIYGDEGYLMNTLPVKTATIFRAKWVNALIILVANLVVSAGVILLAYGDNISSMLDATLEITLIIGLIALEIFAIFCEGILGSVLEHYKNIKSRGQGIMYGFIAFILSQLFVFLALPISAIFEPRVITMLSEPQGIMDFEVIRILIIVSIVMYVIAIGVVSVLAARKISKGINLE